MHMRLSNDFHRSQLSHVIWLNGILRDIDDAEHANESARRALDSCNFIKEKIDVETKSKFYIVMSSLIDFSTSSILRPCIHLDFHGDKNLGIKFSDGSYISWSEVAKLIAILNNECNGRLVVVATVCYGTEIINRSDMSFGFPCYLFVGSTGVVDFTKVARDLPDFYMALESMHPCNAARHFLKRMTTVYSIEVVEHAYKIYIDSVFCGESSISKFRENLLSRAIASVNGNIEIKKARKNVKSIIRSGGLVSIAAKRLLPAM